MISAIECSSIESRTDEVVQCQTLLNNSVMNEDDSFMPPFLIHSFEEVSVLCLN